MNINTRILAAGFLSIFLLASSAFSQEAPNSDAATLPSPGVFVFRQQFRLTEFDKNDPLGHNRDVTEYQLLTRLSYGIAKDLSVTLDAPVSLRRIDESLSTDYTDDFGLDDGLISLKWRPIKFDTGPIDTTRIAFTLGTYLPWGNPSKESGSPFSSGSFDPVVGVVMTSIRGRHGVNLGARYRLNFGDPDDGSHPEPTGPGMSHADAIYADASYVYRLYPQAFTADHSDGVYFTAELNGVYETNGDTEVLASPGLMYETQNFTLETGLQLPAYQKVDNRLSVDWVFVFGVRVQW